MPINPQNLINEIERQAEKLRRRAERQAQELPLAIEQYLAARNDTWLTLEQLSRGQQAGAMPVEELHQPRAINACPESYTVVATDGSAIPPDRHGGMAFCQVQNMGLIMLSYGKQPQAVLDSDTRFYLLENEGEHDNNTTASQMLEARGSVEELLALLELAGKYHATVALRDGPLTLWASSILNSPAGKQLTADYLEKIKEFGKIGVPVIGYTSNSRSDAVITALREMSNRSYQGLLDADLFRQILQPGEYTAAFRNSPRHPKDAALTEEVFFMYLKTDYEMVRLEFSHAFLGSPPLQTALAIILRQADLGQGYPVALMEAHEQAVLRGDDRTLLRILLEEQGLLTVESEKGRSKRLRGI
jgi:NurA domain